MTNLLTPAQAREALDRQGIGIAEFAREHGLNKAIAYQVLSGKKKGRRGESHRAAVLLGLKEGTFPAAPEILSATNDSNPASAPEAQRA